MTATVRNIVFDCADPYELARFWSAVTGHPPAADDFPGDPEASIAQPGGPTLFFCAVPEPKVAKNRVHVCLVPDTTRDEELVRVLGLGATMVGDMRRPDGSGWVVLADPAGNEFCLLRGDAERHSPVVAGS